MVKEIRFYKFKKLVVWTKWEIRYRREPPGVRNMRAVQKTGFCGTRRVSRRALHRKGPLPFWRLLYSVQAMLSSFSGSCKIRYRRGPPGVRNMRAVLKKASWGTRRVSDALGAQNRLLWYGRDIRYRKRPPTVRGASSVLPKTPIRTAFQLNYGKPTFFRERQHSAQAV